jgi:manganese-dependent inorganic pyrophosphatase
MGVKMKTYVVGHKNPDTDSIVSAIVFANLETNSNKEYVPARSGEINKETEYVLRRFGFEVPVLIPQGEKRVILVDHNSPEEGPLGLKPEEVIGVFDHHKLGGPFSAEPIIVKVFPYGCTATVANEILKEKDIKPDANMAGIMISAIVSDTLNLTSPTTTEKDRAAIKELNKIANLDVNELANEMFAAKSDISDIETEELIGKDYKVFDLNGKKVGVGVWETVLPQKVLERKNELMELLTKKKQAENLDCIYFGVVNIFNKRSDMCIVSEKEKKVAEEVFGAKTVDGLMVLDGVVSRKKQMIPALESYFQAN